VKKKAVIIGSGIAGLASAIRLSVKGYDVSVIEKNNYLGGKLTVLTLGDYRFDAGPSLFTLPHLVDELFQLAHKNPRDYFAYEKMETACHYFFEDGVVLHYYADKKRLFEEIETKLHIDSAKLEQHLKKSERIYKATYSTFLEQSLHKFSNYLSLDILKCIAQIPNLNLFTSLHAANEKGLNHPKLVQLFDRYATYNGSNPYLAPGILQIIPHLEVGFGTFFPSQGMHSITTSLVQLAIDLGVTFHYNESVTKINHTGKRISGVTTSNSTYDAEIVVCNSDIKPAYAHLLTDIKAPKKVMQQEPSSSAMIFYWGMKQTFPQLDLHNIFFSENYEREFKSIFEDLTVDEDPTVYVHISSKVVKTDAPEGCENWFVMINVPSNQGQNWEQLRGIIRKRIIAKLNRLLKTDIEPLIETEDFLDPIRIEQRTSSYGGALYGASSNDRMAAFFRHPNFSKTKGLYFAGGSVHPGGGIPLCLLSAKIATDLVPCSI
jgi:diapolycopene oxygenase